MLFMYSSMEEEELLRWLYGTTYVDLIPAIETLSRDTKALLDEEFSFEKFHKYCISLSILRRLVGCLSDFPDLDTENVCEQCTLIAPKQSDERIPPSKTSRRLSVVKEVIDKICWPLLHKLNPSSDTRKEILVLLGNVCEIVEVCVKCDKSNSVLNSFLETSLSFLEIFLIEKPLASDTVHNTELIDIYCLSEVLRSVLLKACDKNAVKTDSKLHLNLSKIFDKCLEAGDLIEIDVVGSICLPLMTRILKLQSDFVVEKSSRIWEMITSFSEELTKSHSDDRKIYMLLCGFANFLFPLNGICAGLDLRCDSDFWALLQKGLLSKDSVNRKRSLYLTKRIVDICETNCLEVNSGPVSDLTGVPVFCWSKKNATCLTKIWQDMILLLEVFEEKQVSTRFISKVNGYCYMFESSTLYVI